MSALEELLLFQMKAAKLPHPEREFLFAAPERRFRFDFAWPLHKVAVEVDGATWSGGRHSRGSGIERDAEKMSLAAVLGWRVVRLTKHMVEDGTGLAYVERALGLA